MKPGFINVITYGNPKTEDPPANGRTSGRRRALAEWLGSAENPLTARVIVNRIWSHHFGQGIVGTLDNFGKMGEKPTHPELLDWLAVEFMSRGWSIKQMHRLMMTSEAYQMSSQHQDAGDTEKDPDNQYLWRFRIQRLDAEIVRDAMMAASGALDLTMGGPPVFPHIPGEILRSMSEGIWKKEEDGPRVWRRSVYVYRKRGLPFPMFEVFDLPDQNISCGRRNVSTVPTQALTLLNDEFVLRQSKLFADRDRGGGEGRCGEAGGPGVPDCLVEAPARRRSEARGGFPEEANARRLHACAFEFERISIRAVKHEKFLVETRFPVSIRRRCERSRAGLFIGPGGTAGRGAGRRRLRRQSGGLQSVCAAQAALRAARHQRDLAVHERRRQPSGYVRPQTGAGADTPDSRCPARARS